jgi:hypothetical protein
MASQAQSSQGTVVWIGKSTLGAAKTITAVTQANPAVVTSNAHGLLEGDIVTIAAVVGMTQLNGKTFIVANPSTNTFELFGVDSTAYGAYTSGGTATPVDFVQWCELRSGSFGGGQASEIDVTNMCSTSKEFRLGLRDNGEFTGDYNWVPADLGQKEAEKAQKDGVSRWFRLTMPAIVGGAVLFEGLVRSISTNFGVDQAFQGSVNVRITGDISYVI